MNFFEHQQLARRNSRVMVVLFVLSVAAVIVAVNVVLAAIYIVWADSPAVNSFARVPRSVYTWGAIVTFAVICVVSLWNIVGLAGGGAKVAKMMGGRALAQDSRDPLERRLLNIVEEMAIASGVRLPQVYVMDGEKGINAFAAGWSASETVVAVTRGTLEQLTRDELQGVVGHEFSHILNGDMGLNIRMVGVLAGIVAIGSIGGFMMRGAAEADDIRAAAPLFAIGLSLFVIGYTGLFFARLIKAAVSRQREFLADASSVQFTRNPDGIAGALDQMRAGSFIRGRYAEEMSHMFFGQGVKVWFDGLLATHPPLDERIERVNPGFRRTDYRARRAAAAPQADAQAAAPRESDAALGFTSQQAVPPAGRRSVDNGIAWGRSAGDSARMVGTLEAAKVDYAARLLASLPAALREAVRDAQGACGALVALLLAPAEDVRREQLRAMEAAGLAGLAARAAGAVALTQGLGAAYHLPVVDLALPAVKAASPEQKKELVAGLQAVINADRRVSLHQFVVLALVRDQLAPRGKPPAAGRKLAEMQAEAAILLSLVAHAGTRADATGSRADGLALAMRAGAATMGFDASPAAASLTLEAADAALQALKRLAPLQKALLLKGLFAAVIADGTIRVVEAELMRLVGAVLDCPLPPLLAEMDPAALAQ